MNTGTWFCTADCGGGTCIPVMNNTCPAPNPQGCLNNGCPNGLRCDLNAGCVSSQCKCDFNSGAWVCTKD